MNPRAIELHIEELVLHGFDPAARWNVGDALENELRALLVKRGIPPAWQVSPEQIEAGAVRANVHSKPAVMGKEIARAVYRGGAR